LSALDFFLTGLLLSLSFFFSGSETSLFSLSKLKLEEIKRSSPGRGLVIEKLLDKPQQLLVSILICNVFANVLATTIATRNIINVLFPDAGPWLAVVIMTLLILVFGEVIPKTIAIRISSQISQLVAPVFWFLTKLLLPFIAVFRGMTTIMVAVSTRLFYRKIIESESYQTDEMLHVIRDSREKGILDSGESSLLDNVIQFHDTDIQRMYVPRSQMTTISIEATFNQLLALIKEHRFSRIPVWEDEEDNIIGIIYVKDILTYKASERRLTHLRKKLRQPYFVPCTIKAERLMHEFQLQKNHMAIVIDEFGSLAGLITFEDVLEEIIGEVVDRNDVKPSYHRLAPGMFEIEATLEIAELNQLMGTRLVTNGAVTVGGYVLEKIRRIPEPGEIINLGPLMFKITGARPNKIESILVTRRSKIVRREKTRQKTGEMDS
jgi:putative hemolysin